MRKLSLLTFVLIGLLAPGFAAQAVPITGEIHFAGLWSPTPGPGTGTATGIDFSQFTIVLAGTGTYAGLAGTGAAFQDFTFAPFGGSVAPLWSVSSGGVDYSFDLTSVAVAFQSSTQLTLSGTGILHATGFDDTPARWDFTGNAGAELFSFSADNVAVPEPATLGIVTLGLIGLAVAGTRRPRLD
jgi:hypothetical protein